MTSSSLPTLIQQMLQPEAYPYPVSGQVQLLQTHASFVLLTGEYAYKIKKPVNFGFLDYSTLEKRHHFCCEEVRLNRRCAPALYLGVVPIVQVGETVRLSGTGQPVEYAVKMRQFDQEGLLINLLEQGRLTPALMEELAGIVAAFHAIAATNDHIRSFGTVEQIRAAIEENYARTEQYIGGPQTQQQFNETRAYTDRFFAERVNLLLRRQQQDRIRECHGDLHLRNICLWQDQLYLFDCIEFNESFRFVDVMYDVAFTVMDLEARQQPDLGNVFLNIYAEQTGDWEGLQVLPLYLCRQAYVRAKVNSLLLDDPNISEAERVQATKSAAAYYRLAWQYTRPHQGRLLLMSGLSGSGKTTVARQIAPQLSAIHIRSDAVRKHLGGIPLHERGPDRLYTPEMTTKTYARLLELGVALARQGFPVILDAKYDRQAVRTEAIAQAEAHQIPLQILHCTAPVTVLRSRLHQRTDDIADATAELLSTQMESAEPFTAKEQAYTRSIDTTQDIATQLRADFLTR